MNEKRTGAAIVALFAFVVAASALRNGFALDDVHIIVDNARVHSLKSFWELFGQTYWPPERGASLYRPLTMLSFAVQWVIGDGSPFVFHMFSGLLFAATCGAFYVLVSELANGRIALLCGLLFAAHPVHVEVFANVVGQAEMWVAFLVIVATTRFVRARKAGTLDTADVAVISVLYFAACMFKEHAIVFPAIVVACDLIMFARTETIGEKLRRSAPVFASLVGVGLVFVVLRTMVAGGVAGGTNEIFRGVSFGARVLTMLTVVLEWARLFVWPADLSADYSFPRTRVATEFSTSMLPALLILASCVFVAWRMRVVRPVVTFAFAWILVALVIPSNLVLVTGFVLAERTLFLASAGFAILIAVAIVRMWELADERSRVMRIAAAVAVGFVLLAGAAKSWMRAPVWRDNATLFRQTVHDVPTSSRAHWMLAEHLAKTEGPRAGIDEMLIAVALGRKDDPLLLGFAADQLSMADMCPRAISFYLGALQLTPENVQLRANTSLCLVRMGRIDEARAVAQAGTTADSSDPRIVRIVAISDSLAAVRAAQSVSKLSTRLN